MKIIVAALATDISRLLELKGKSTRDNLVRLL